MSIKDKQLQSKFKFRIPSTIDLTQLRIENHRVTLAAINSSYAHDIYNEFDSTITRYMMPKPADSIEETEAFIAESLRAMQEKEDLVLVILNKQTNEFLGCCGFHVRGNCDTPELGIWLKKGAHGQKYGLEAIQALCRWAVTHIVFDYAIYPVDKANIASRKIPEALDGEVFATDTVTTMSGTQLNEVIYKLPFKDLSFKF